MNYTNLKLEDLSKVAKDIVNIVLSGDSFRDSFVIYLEGDMGAGKTTLAQKIGKALGVDDHMQSPTFTLMREYDLPTKLKINNLEIGNKYKKLLHIDAYRFEDRKEGQVLQLDNKKVDNIILIEWPANMYAPDANMIVNIKKKNEELRDLDIKIFKK